MRIFEVEREGHLVVSNEKLLAAYQKLQQLQPVQPAQMVVVMSPSEFQRFKKLMM